MTWTDWERAWRLHAQRSSFRRRVERTLDDLRALGREGVSIACGLSGGKDSAVVASLCGEAGIEVEFFHVGSGGLDLPGTLTAVDELADHLGVEFDLYEPADLGKSIREVCERYSTPVPQEVDAWALLDAYPKSMDLEDVGYQASWYVGCKSLGQTYIEEMGFDVVLLGMRARESSGRMIYANVWGADHCSQDGRRQVCPILRWTGDDVYAYIVDRGLPLHPHYQRVWESGLCSDEHPERIRVSEVTTSATFGHHGSLALLKRLYPEVWRTLTRIRPEVAAQA